MLKVYEENKETEEVYLKLVPDDHNDNIIDLWAVDKDGRKKYIILDISKNGIRKTCFTDSHQDLIYFKLNQEGKIRNRTEREE